MIPYIPPSISTLFKVGPAEVHLFGILVAIGILVGSDRTRVRARQLGIPDDETASLATTVVVMGFIVAHVFDVLAYQPEELARRAPLDALILLVNITAGLSSYGGFLGALIGLLLWTRFDPGGHERPGLKGFLVGLVWWKRRETPFSVIACADSLLFGLSYGWFFGRMGCFTAHDHPGAFTDFFLAVKYPDGARHDLGLDEALFALALALLFTVLIRKNRPLGFYAAIATTFYGPVRFVLDFLRVQHTTGADPRYFGLTPAQYGSLGVFVTGLVLLVGVARRSRAGAPTAAR